MTEKSISPPTYDEAARERSLQASFMQLTQQHGEIRTLFMKVARELEASPKIGAEHRLTHEWSALSKKHKKLYRDSQQNASTCANFLKHYADVLVPLSGGQATAEEQKAVITDFVEGIPGHQQSAREMSNAFGELAEDVERFPARVEQALQEAERGWFHVMKVGVQWVCDTIWKALKSLFNSIINAFRTVISCVRTMRFSCGPFVAHIVFNRPCAPSSLISTPPKPLQESVKDAAHNIARTLTGFEDAWHLTSLACDHLMRYVQRADLLSAMPGSFHAYIPAAEIQRVYYPMVQCMEDYARGKMTA